MLGSSARSEKLTPLIFGVITNAKQTVFVEYSVDIGELE